MNKNVKRLGLLTSRKLVFWIALLQATCAVGATPQTNHALMVPARNILSYSEIIGPALQGVVRIQTLRKMPQLNAGTAPQTRTLFGQDAARPDNVGAGFVIDSAKGLIVTTAAIIADADSIRVTLSDGRAFSGTVVGSDAEGMVGLIRIQADNLAMVVWADAKTLRIGDVILNVGNPYDLGLIVTAGVTSGFIHNPRLSPTLRFVVTDAAAFAGSAGGPLLDGRGRVVGMIVAQFANSKDYPLGFAISVDDIQKAVKVIESKTDK